MTTDDSLVTWSGPRYPGLRMCQPPCRIHFLIICSLDVNSCPCAFPGTFVPGLGFVVRRSRRRKSLTRRWTEPGVHGLGLYPPESSRSSWNEEGRLGDPRPCVSGSPRSGRSLPYTEWTQGGGWDGRRLGTFFSGGGGGRR